MAIDQRVRDPRDKFIRESGQDNYSAVRYARWYQSRHPAHEPIMR